MIRHSAQINLSRFFESRYSIRNFSEEPIDPRQIVAATKLAQKTPSVCKRQSARVYAFTENPLHREVLACKHGNSGFGHQAAAVLVVTSALPSFFSPDERNQCWIDGGLFCMSLIYALHSMGLGTCCLNWCVNLQDDRNLREVADLPESESIIMQIAVGHLPETLKVAKSIRKPLNQILRINRSAID